MAERLRRAIRNSGMDQKTIATKAGVDPGVVSRFMRAERGITLAVFERLCKLVGLELREVE